ncbi:hypothetical protein [Pelagimonas varians]|uniref:Uncharacterized protein n=1 Tax=Pelagimonas varians TaxID=696760 RepID=A0A238L143_9RHOB|nr:hypothetical protein [Pelagimonas varians]PYG26810.1 hypothetical protein C8N36_1191 [Pelagimonas varians]SMX48805.1 hypothetical protein PEV8663_03956 [Pelagimonas varians]
MNRQSACALLWQNVPEFNQGLSESNVTHLALRLLILTAVRSCPFRFPHMDPIEGDVWTIPGEARKERKDPASDFRVPLSAEALTVIEQANPIVRVGYQFPRNRKGVIYDMTMSNLMKRCGMDARTGSGPIFAIG